METLVALDVTVLWSVALTSRLLALIVPPAANALLVPAIKASDLTALKEPLPPSETDTAPASVVGWEFPTNDAWMLTTLPSAVRVPPVTDAVTFGWIFSSLKTATPAAPMAPNAAAKATAKVVTAWFAEART